MKKDWWLGIAVCFILLCCLTACGADTKDNTWEQLDLTQAETNQQGEGWFWDAAEKRLTLDGLQFIWNTRDRRAGSAIRVPDNTEIVLAENSENQMVIKGRKDALIGAIESPGNLYITGNGSLEITGEYLSDIIWCGADLELSGGSITIENNYSDCRGIALKNQYLQSAGTVRMKGASVIVNDGIVIDGGILDVENNWLPINVYNGNVIINGGKVSCRQSGEAEPPHETGEAVWSECMYDNWIINGGELYTTGVRTNGGLIVNDGMVQVDGVGVNLGSVGRYEQNGGSVIIDSNRAGIFNRITSEGSNETSQRIKLSGGELQIHCNNPEYSAIEFVMAKPLEQDMVGGTIDIADNMELSTGNWVTENVHDYPKMVFTHPQLWERDNLQEFDAETRYVFTTLQPGTKIDMEHYGIQDIVIKEKS